MKVLHKNVLLKEIRVDDNGPIPGLNEIDHLEVAFKSDEITDLNIGDTVIYRSADGKVKIGEEEYLLVAYENVKVVL